MAEGQPGGGHGGDDEKKAPEISGVNATLGNQVVDRTGKQEGEDCGGDGEGSQMDQGTSTSLGEGRAATKIAQLNMGCPDQR